MFLSAMNRTRVLALLLVAVFSIGALGVASVASAQSDASTAKKSKKCKKGYKKVKGKCKKKKKSGSTTQKVEKVVLKLATSNGGQVKITGEIITNVAKSGQLSGDVTVTVGGVPQKIATPFALSRSDTRSHFSKIISTTFANTDGGTVTVTVGGKTSPVETIR